VGRVIIVRCPLCGWSKRHRAGTDPRDFLTPPEDDVILLEVEVGGKVPGTGGGEGSGRGSSRGRMEGGGRVRLGDLDRETKEALRQKIEKVLKKL